MEKGLPNSDEVKCTLHKFRDFLNSSWSTIDSILWEHDWDEDPYILEDWLNENWKILFARQVLGKDCDLQPFSRSIVDENRESYKYRLEITKPIHSSFFSLGTNAPEFDISPPFDQVRVISSDGKLENVPFTEAHFQIVRIKKLGVS